MYDYDDKVVEGYSSDSSGAKKPKNGSTAKKVFGAIGLAVLFGAVSAFTFQGTSRVIDKVFPKEETKVTENTTEQEQPVKEIEKVETPKQTVETQKVTATDKYTVAEVAEQSMPSIVAITNKSVQEVRSFYGMGVQQYESTAAGSGIIIGQNDTELLIATNAHVIENADTLSVSFIDNEVYEAQAKGSDTVNDIAIVSVKLSDIKGSTLDSIKIATIGDSDELVIGEQVVAIGNALGYGQSVTTGIVSALNRTIDGSEDGAGYIQTDAAINPGNSGGALLNMKGEVIGINSAKLANTKIEGMCYAIPIDVASPILDGLMNLASRDVVSDSEAGYLGITGFTVTDEVAMAYGIPEGVYVSEAIEGGAANNAGIQKGDVIVKFDGMNMDSINKLKERLKYYKAGEQVSLVIARADNGEYVEKEINVILLGKEQSGIETTLEPESSDGDSSSEGSQNDGQKSGEFNIGGNRFSYSVPGDLFNIFGN